MRSEASTAPAAGNRSLTLRQAIVEAIAEEMEADPAVVMIGQDLGAFEGPLKSAEGLFARFGAERIIEVGICESSMTSLGVGMAVQGMRPIVELMFSDFLPIAATAIVQLAANLRYYSGNTGSVPMVIRVKGGDGPYRSHPQNYEAMFAHSPGLTIVAPSDAVSAKGLMKSAIRSNDPVLFIENIFLYNAFRENVPAGEIEIPLGKAEVAREGGDVTIVTYGRTVRTALAAARELARNAIEAEVIDLRTIAPFDEEAVLRSVRKTGRLVAAHEAWEVGGIGAEIVSRVTRKAFGSLACAPELVGAPAVPVPWAEPLRDMMIPSVARIVEAVMKVLPK
ncbi:MAG TPA: transketolase C-terminal domain-containing protein [Allosphingosinicella sp.]|nr:transketolase C-terminal domain-containing protein [Allosphingosinicella sp.]